jgi:NTP pyrophosphatase (non-canonical NTP hydrolase)
MTMREKIARAIHNAAPCSDDPETNAVLFDEMRELRLKEADAVLALIEPVMEENIADVWRQADENHRRYSDTGDRENDIRFLTLGLTGEAGEVANFVKKRWRDGDGHDEEIQKEIADVCAYAFMLANTMGMTPADLIRTIAEKQQVFIAKMQARAALSPSEKQDG